MIFGHTHLFDFFHSTKVMSLIKFPSSDYNQIPYVILARLHMPSYT